MNSPEVKVIRGNDYAAKIIKTGTADSYFMVQVEIPELFEGAVKEDLPWATYKLPVGAGPNHGEFTPASEGDYVWVDFPFLTEGVIDTRRPRVTGAMHYAPEEVPALPHEVFHGDEKLVHKRTSEEPEVPEREVGTAKVATFHGITIELEQEGAYRVTHRDTGTALEITEQGDIVSHSEKKQYLSAKEEGRIETGKSLMIEVIDGNCTIKAPKIDLGKDGLEPMVLGDMLADLFQNIKTLIENHTHIGNLGAPSSTFLAAVGPFNITDGLIGGGVYSKKNRTQ